MERVNKNCIVCGKNVSILVNVHFMIATNLAQARNNGTAAYCQNCDASYCFDHILWTPARVSEDSQAMTNIAVCPKCGKPMAGILVR